MQLTIHYFQDLQHVELYLHAHYMSCHDAEAEEQPEISLSKIINVKRGTGTGMNLKTCP
jgi:hypothetical protein